MSSLYNLEPQPTGKVLLFTTAGDIEIELFAKQTPLASRNFLQLCLDGYYNDTVFHRLVPGFILQGGDPTGTGSGGESSYEDALPFADEIHSRLKFNRRGLLGMANSGKKDDNGSQFFFTLGDTPELTGKNTMFGRVVGDTIYNLMKMADVEMAEDGGERPLYPQKITGTEILVNPFEDMVKRDLNRRAIKLVDKSEKKKPKRKAGKALLSFGGDEGDDIAPAVVKKPKFNPKLVSAREEEVPMSKEAVTVVDLSRTKPAEKPEPKPQKATSPSPLPRRDQILASIIQQPKRSKPRSPSPTSSRSPSPSLSPKPVSKSAAAMSKANAQIAELKASLRRTGPAAPAAPKKKSALEALIPETSIRGRKRRPGITNQNKDEQAVLSMFKAFKEKLEQMPAEEDVPKSPDPDQGKVAGKQGSAQIEDNDDEEAALCDLHFVVNCQSCSRWDQNVNNTHEDADDDFDSSAWMKHKLTFAKDRLGKDLEWKRKNEEELVVIDPREKAKELAGGKDTKKGKGKAGTDWDREKRALR